MGKWKMWGCAETSENRVALVVQPPKKDHREASVFAVNP